MRLDDEMKRLLDEPNYAHVATLMADGGPQVTPVWVGTEGDRVLFYKSATSIAYRNLQRDPRIALSIVAVRNPYRGGYARGHVVELRGCAEARQWLTETALVYLGEPYPAEQLEQLGEGALVVVEISRFGHHDVPSMRHPGLSERG